MTEIKNYTPDESLYAFGTDAYLKIDSTENSGCHTVNIEMRAGKRLQGQQGLQTDDSVVPINIQLDIFELVSLAGVLLGHIPQLKIRRNSKFIEIKRQVDFNTQGASCYVVGSGEGRNLCVPLTSSRIFCASLLCVSRLNKNHPGMPVSAILDSLAATGLSGNEIERTHEPRHRIEKKEVLSFGDREIPMPTSTDPGRQIPRRNT